MAQETMNRLFHFKTTVINHLGCNIIEEDRYLQIGDIVIINGEMMRIQEDPEGGVIWVVYVDYTKGYTEYMRHENDVESIVNSDYEEH